MMPSNISSKAVWQKIQTETPPNGDGVDRIEGAYAKWRAGSPLAIKTMTDDNQFRWFRKR